MIDETRFNDENNIFLNKHGDFVYILGVYNVSVKGCVIRIYHDDEPRYWNFKDYLDDMADVIILGIS